MVKNDLFFVIFSLFFDKLLHLIVIYTIARKKYFEKLFIFIIKMVMELNQVFVDKTINFIKKNTNYSSKDISKIKYGLEGIFLTLTKVVIIFLIAFFSKTLVLVILTLIFFNILRFFAFGLHAKKSWQCLISSIILFNILPLVLTKFMINNTLIIIISLFSITSFLLFAPSDTEKRPLTNKRKNLYRKIASIITGILFTIMIFLFDSLKVPLLCSLLIESIMINPLSYIIMGVPFNNYKNTG